MTPEEFWQMRWWLLLAVVVGVAWSVLTDDDPLPPVLPWLWGPR